MSSKFVSQLPLQNPYKSRTLDDAIADAFRSMAIKRRQKLEKEERKQAAVLAAKQRQDDELPEEEQPWLLPL